MNQQHPTPSQSANDPRDFDIILIGATGYCGVFAAEYLVEHYPPESQVRWALAARSTGKLKKVVERLHEIADWVDQIELIEVDNTDEELVEALVKRTRAVATVVGPFDLYGSLLVEKCVEFRTHYTDITGESLWIKEMIDKHHEKAKANGTFIVPSCGFDSVPSCLGSFVLADHMQRLHGQRVRKIEGGMFTGAGYQGNRHEGEGASGKPGGGTIKSLLLALKKNEKAFFNPDLLVPSDVAANKFERKEQSVFFPEYTNIVAKEPWSTVFIMSCINEKTVRRSVALQSDLYGDSFSYRESMTMPNRFAAFSVTFLMTLVYGVAKIFPASFLLKILPKTSQTPPKRPSGKYKRGHFEFVFRGSSEDGSKTAVSQVVGTGEGGYEETSKMLIEAALCLALTKKEIVEGSKIQGGLVTASVLGREYIDRLEKKEMTFKVFPGNTFDSKATASLK